ncbi:AaceriADR348Cp [[Ashbya] aceris (nom. inval.)]|nr:AaceriADR348Cp [[Ashbya] aceris (nom. inval.)]
MSRILTDLSLLQAVVSGATSGERLVLLRIFAQYEGIAPSAQERAAPLLCFRTIPYFDTATGEVRTYPLAIDEKTYYARFIERPPPHQGDILDLRCGLIHGEVEIMHVDAVSMRELARLRSFLATEDGRQFMELTGIQ